MKKQLLLALYTVLALINAALPAAAQETNEILTNASAVLALSGDQASQGIKVRIKAVVTASEPDWGGRFFVQDSSGGVFVENISSDQPSIGDIVTITGVTFPGGYAPTISRPHWETVGTAPLPAPKPVAIEQLMSGAEDGQRIEISGIVRSAQVAGGLLLVELASGGYRVPVYIPAPPGVDSQKLVGAKVNVKGTAATTYNAQLRHLISIDIYVPLVTDFVVEKPAGPDPFDRPFTPLNNIAQYPAGRSFPDRVHVKGILEYQRLGRDLFIRDGTGGLHIKTSQTLPLSPGDSVEAVGFPEFENFLPVLADAVFKKMPNSRTQILPTNAPVDELLQGLRHSELITIRGKLLDRVEEQTTSYDQQPNIKTILVLQASNRVFTTEAETMEPSLPLKSIPIGSVIEATGICFLQLAEDGKIQSFQILLPKSNSVSIIAEPSWFTPGHLLVSLALALVVIIVGTTWTIMILKRNAALRHLIHQREQDQKELQRAHDTLEWRVKERTEQLKFQVTARKESEVQFKATLTERTRLAKELHDTIEQTMTGITLQLNTANKLLQQDPGAAAHHLGLIRNMVRMSRVELRRSIWDLRSRELEQFDLYKALSLSANRIASGAGIRVDAETKGSVRPLPEVIEETLLRIGQEAVTNTVKHSNAKSIKINLEFGHHNIALEIIDDGKGFDPDGCAGPNEGHFGLLGMAERAKRLGGLIAVTSSPGAGTLIRVELPIKWAESSDLIDEQTDYRENIADSHPHS